MRANAICQAIKDSASRTVKIVHHGTGDGQSMICAVCHGALYLDTGGAQANKVPRYGGIVQYTELTEINSAPVGARWPWWRSAKQRFSFSQGTRLYAF